MRRTLTLFVMYVATACLGKEVGSSLTPIFAERRGDEHPASGRHWPNAATDRRRTIAMSPALLAVMGGYTDTRFGRDLTSPAWNRRTPPSRIGRGIIDSTAGGVPARRGGARRTVDVMEVICPQSERQPLLAGHISADFELVGDGSIDGFALRTTSTAGRKRKVRAGYDKWWTR